MVICLQMGKTSKAKISSGDFKVTTFENPLLSQQVVSSKGISVPYTNLQLNPYPNTQLDLFYSENFSFQCTAPSTWLTTNLRRILAPKFFNSSTRWRSQNSLVTKPYGIQTQQFLQEKDELGQLCLRSQCACNNKCNNLFIKWDGP